MRTTTPGRRARIAALAASAVVVSPLAVGTMSAQADDVSELQLGETKTYIVQLADDPLVAFNGGHGLAATAPQSGEKLDVDSAAAAAYTDFLATQRAEVLQTVGLSSSDVVTTYDVALNGFAVKMSGVDALHMRKAPGVVQVWEDEIRHADTVQTPDYLGLSGEGGVWAEQFGGVENAGDGIVVGVIDTGIDPLNPSFAEGDMPAAPEDWAGSCDEAGVDSYAAFECNNKVIGARWYGAEFGNTVIPEEFTSARDYNGHGSHTAGTAAGNHGVPLAILGADLGEASGMAPAAHIAVYKGLWMTADGNGSGTTAGLLAAINDAVEDGVDVINYSISGSSTSVVGPDEIAFLYAADAGIFVSTSAGNSGDTVGVSSVAHNAPWTMTVAASTHNRGALNSVTLGNDATYNGVGYGGPLEETALVNAADIPAASSTPAAADLCGPGTVDDTEAEGKIVVCTRGEHALVDKAAEVINSGGVGMIMINAVGGAGSQNAIIYGLPATHLNATDGVAVKAYAATEGATASISETTNTVINAPEMASFSSYGPALAGGGDLLKPDITGPGVDIAAAYHAKHGEPGTPTFDQISGTSMSAPHIAGLAALMKQEFPGWSPAAIKSAMMTTARDVDDNGDPIERLGVEATPLNYGAGEVQPAPSYNPGLVYDAGWDEWTAYACSIGQLGAPCPETPVDPSDLNYPSISIGDLAGQQTVTRTVTDVTGEGGTWDITVDEPAGISVDAPASITVEAGGTASFEVAFTVTSAEPEAWNFGQLRLSNGDITVESPIALRALAIAGPDEVSGEGTSGTLDYSITTGFDGEVTTDIDGLIPSDVTDVVAVSDGPGGGQYVDDGWLPFTVPEGTKTLRVSIFDEEITPGETDMDLFLVGPSNTIIAESAVGGSDESVTLQDPAPGSYAVALDYWNGAAGAEAVVPTHIWAVSDTDEGNLTVTPDTFPAAIGQSVDLTLDWTGLEADSRYLGAVNFSDGTDQVGKTLVSITTGADGELAVDRVFGADRYGTAAAIAAEYPDGADTVFVASGQEFADALTGSAVAGSGTMETADGQAAPVLLVKKNAIPQDTAAALTALNPSNVVVLGGTAAVSAGVESSLDAYGTVTRIGGVDRYETAALLAQQFPTGVSTVYVAVGEGNNFADALSVSALAGSQGAPVLLTKTNHAPNSLTAAIAALNPGEVVVVGGTGAVSDAVAAELGATTRLSGGDRYETNAAITAAYPADAAQAYVASGLNWPDALSGAALAGHMDAPLVLTQTSKLPNVTEAELDRLSPAAVTIFGGTGAVSQAVEDALNALLPSWQ
ncbi:S8 family serine peptidase [Ornithinimicrobium ciconiae]|uniref:S8 family serine peptidase n=1 Tax=Ornithinimicrobium ciconiae TaxID=2594265 RepID=A0A516GEY6_9MICO|nr:cell wall-binding repeat-containing protein [Ornithinimicrobium ciconiae]QDO90097.1 S8 family serine peptidase [Ornithinimicrobium ciconiae]